MTAKLLGVNIDHVATIKTARGAGYPSITKAAQAVFDGGGDFITVHLREDRRHICDEDVFALKAMLPCRLNLEMAVTEEMLTIASQVKPSDVCLVPEKRQELTTEGGLNLKNNTDIIYKTVQTLRDNGSVVSLFIEPATEQIDLAKKMGANAVELHTGAYAEGKVNEIERLKAAAHYAGAMGLQVNAGHGLTLDNLDNILKIDTIKEFNIGHALVSDALFIGLTEATKQFKQKIQGL